MLKTLRLITLAAATALVLPAIAGSWPNLPARKAAEKPAAAAPAAKPAKTRSLDGFEPADGEAGWQLSQHKYELSKGKLVMSDECDHKVRQAQAPAPGEVERVNRQLGGA